MNTDITGDSVFKSIVNDQPGDSNEECMTYWKDGLCIKDKKINTYHTGEAMFSTESEEYEIYNEEFRNSNIFRDDFTNLSLPTTSSIDQNINMGIDETEDKSVNEEIIAVNSYKQNNGDVVQNDGGSDRHEFDTAKQRKPKKAVIKSRSNRLLKPCTCKKQCSEKISDDQRTKIHEQF